MYLFIGLLSGGESASLVGKINPSKWGNMRFFSSLFLVMVLGLFSCTCFKGTPAVTNPSMTELVQRERDATVMLVENDQEGNLASYCSGVWINDEQILTAYHCVRDTDMFGMATSPEGSEIGKKIEVAYYYDYMPLNHAPSIIKESHTSVVIKLAPGSDLALLKINDAYHSHHYAPVAQGAINDADPVTVVGHPLGYGYVWLPGTIVYSEYMESPHGYIIKMLMITSSAYFGNSGGAAFNMNGEVIGICSWLTRGPQMTFFVHRDEIAKFLTSQE